MIETFADLGLKDIDKVEEVDLKIKEKLGLGVDILQEKIGSYVASHAEELSLQFRTITPFGKYENLIENNDDMASFLKESCSKPEHWKLEMINPSDVNKSLIEFVFYCDAVDDQDNFKGFAFVSMSGKVRHCFARSSDQD
jgi:hypothetical protein